MREHANTDIEVKPQISSKNFRVVMTRPAKTNFSKSDRVNSRYENAIVSSFSSFHASLVSDREHLNSALWAIRNIDDQCEPGDIPPTETLKTNVEKLINRLYEYVDLPMDIEAMPEGDITINISTDRYDMVFFHCDANGTVYCSVDIGGESEEQYYNDISKLPDNFIISGMKRLIDQHNQK